MEYDEVVSFSLARNLMALYLYVTFDLSWNPAEFTRLYFKAMLHHNEVIYLYKVH